MKKTYRSKLGVETLIVLLIVMGIITVQTLSNEITWKSILLLLMVNTIILLSLFTFSYTIEGDELIVRYSIFYNHRIKIASISKIKETRTLLAGPAASLDRIAVSYGSYLPTILSPHEKKEFITHLLELNPNIKVVWRKK